jgi:hypothetical protein
VLRSLLKSLLKDLLIAVVLLAASLVLPVAGFWMCRSAIGGTVFFFAAPWTCAVWSLLIVQLGGSRFWRGRAHVLAWRVAHGGYVHTILRGTGWMFFGLLASYCCELAAVFLMPPSPASRDLFPLFAYAPALLALWSAARG